MGAYTIVIADDEALARMDLKEMLEEAGHKVVGQASDGVEAWKLVKEKSPDLAILDIKMPKMDGLQAAKLIAHDGLAPVLLLTAFGDEEIIEKAKNSMVFGYVIKPVEEKVLFPAIEIAISQYKKKCEMVNRVKSMEKEIEEKQIINRAKALLMKFYKVTEDQAHTQLQKVSMKRGKSMAEVSSMLVKEILNKKNK